MKGEKAFRIFRLYFGVLIKVYVGYSNEEINLLNNLLG